MTDIADVTSVSVEDGTAGRKRKGSGLDAMLLPELKQLAGSLGIRGAGTLRKGQLIAAIQGAQSGPAAGASAPGAAVNGSSCQRAERSGSRPAIPAAPESSPDAHHRCCRRNPRGSRTARPTRPQAWNFARASRGHRQPCRR